MPSPLLCPQCNSELKLDAPQTSANCSLHGTFRVLFSRASALEIVADDQLSLQPVESAPAIAAVAAPIAPVASVARVRAPLSEKANDESLRALSALGLSEKIKPEVVAAGPVPEGKCAKHPKMDSVQTCTQCNAPMCRMCTYRAPYGKRLCQACLSGGPVAAAAAPSEVVAAAALITQFAAANPAAFPKAAPAAPVVPNYLLGVKCSTHPDVQAVNKCKVCSAGVCETCDFRVGSNVHACPECIMKPREGISADRMKYVVGGFLCAGATGFTYVMGEVQHSSGYMILSLILSMVGVAVSLAPMEKRLTNSIPLWIGVILNLLFFALRIVIVLIVTLSR